MTSTANTHPSSRARPSSNRFWTLFGPCRGWSKKAQVSREKSDKQPHAVSVIADGASRLGRQPRCYAASWQTQCFGRVQFSMPAHLAWYNQQPQPPAFYKGSQPTPAIWRGNYGRDPLHGDKVLVQIAVSRLATLEYWKRDTSYFKPSRGEAQERALQLQTDEIDKRMDELRTQYPDRSQNPEYVTAYKKLIDEKWTLGQAQQHIGKVSTDILWVSEAIENFKEQGRDTAQLEAKLAELLI